MNGRNSLNKAIGIIAAVMILAGTAWLYGAGPLAKPAGGQEASLAGKSDTALASGDGAAEGLVPPQAEEGQATGSPIPSPGAAAKPSIGPEASAQASGAAASATPAPGGNGTGGEGAAGAGTPPPSGSGQPQATPGSEAGTAKPAPTESATTTAKPTTPSDAASGTSKPKPTSGQASPVSKPTAPAATPAVKPKPSAPAAKPPQDQAVTISVAGSAKTGIILKSTRVEAEEGDTVLDVLKKVARIQKLVVDYSGKGAAAYVSGIGNLYEFDEGAGSGWLFSVNGIFSSRSAGTSVLKPGDEVRWVYTTDYGKDVGASDGDGAGSGKGSDD
ncbi:DUF4430 domain-containing protein [Paenibacillus sp. D51F]